MYTYFLKCAKSYSKAAKSGFKTSTEIHEINFHRNAKWLLQENGKYIVYKDFLVKFNYNTSTISCFC